SFNASCGKTKANANEFERALKEEMFDDLQYVQSLEKELDELQYDKTEFLDEYDLLLLECLSKDIMFASQVGVSNDLTKPVTPHSWPQVRKTSFAKPYHVNAPGPSRNSTKRVSFQSPKESVGSNNMVHNYYLEEAKKKAQLQKDKALNSKPSVITPDRLPNTANGSKPNPRNYNQQTRNWPPSMSSRVINNADHIAEKPKIQKPFLKSKDLACHTFKKCIYSANLDVFILKYLSKCPVSHADADMDSFKRCGTSNTFDVGYRVLRDLILHRSSINNSASLSNKFGGFYFIFKFGISGLLHHVVRTNRR
ncbi:hypothetical protein Tco_1296595, partial [Tanacetum coccineum]